MPPVVRKDFFINSSMCEKMNISLFSVKLLIYAMEKNEFSFQERFNNSFYMFTFCCLFCIRSIKLIDDRIDKLKRRREYALIDCKYSGSMELSRSKRSETSFLHKRVCLHLS
jgi:hypothetical protein